MERTDHLGLLLVAVSACLWATVGVATQLVPQSRLLGPELLGLSRTAIAGPVLLGMAWASRQTGLARIRLVCPVLLVVFALCSVVFQICLFRSFAEIGVTLTVFLTVCLPPVLAALAELVWLRRPPRAPMAAALVLAICGLFALVIGPDAADLDRAGNLRGLGLSALASVAFVGMSLAARRLSAVSDPLLVSGLGLALSGVILLPVIALSTGFPAAGTVAGHDVILLLAYLGLVPTALAYFCFCKGMSACRSALSGLVASMVEPMVATLLAIVLLNEALSPFDLAGCLLLMAAMGLLCRESRPATNPRD